MTLPDDFNEQTKKAIKIAENLGWKLYLNQDLKNLIYFFKDDKYPICVYKNDIINGIEEEIKIKTSKCYVSVYGWDEYSESYISHLTELLEAMKKELIT